MLLVKSKELKNLNKNTCRTACYALFCLIFTQSTAFAQSASDTQSLSNPSSVLSIFLSLCFVVAIIFVLAWIMRRFNVTQAGNGQMKVVATMMAGAKEKVIVIEVGDEQYLLGVTAHNINHLAKLEKPIASSHHQQSHNASLNGKAGFQQKLIKAMADTITGNSSSKTTSSSVDASVDASVDRPSTKQKQD